MKTVNLIIFVSIVFAVYFLSNFYIYTRGLQSISYSPSLKLTYKLLFFVCFFSFILGEILTRTWHSPVSTVFIWLGSLWLAAMLYFIIIVFVLDLIRLTNSIIPFYPSFITSDYAKTKFIAFIISISAVALITVSGYINAKTIRVKNLHLQINKKAANLKTLNIVSLSDIHLGSIIGKERLQKIVTAVNSLKPDIVFLVGDIFDGEIGTALKNDYGAEFNKIISPMGVYAVMGNHEYIGGQARTSEYLLKHNIKLLRDTDIIVNNSFYIIGREDRDCSRFSDIKRKSLNELMKYVDKSFPLILLDHQPFNLEQAVENNIDLQISGHTHYGQILPLNYVTSWIFEVSYGYLKKNNTHFYVSSGVGTWGPPLRIGTNTEIVNINIDFLK